MAWFDLVCYNNLMALTIQSLLVQVLRSRALRTVFVSLLVSPVQVQILFLSLLRSLLEAQY